MKKKRITYGVTHLVEWDALIKMGKATLRCSFKGGSVSTQGVIPATFTTDNPVVQLGIEMSDAFRKGKIRVVRSHELDEEVMVEGREPKKASAEADASGDAGEQEELEESEEHEEQEVREHRDVRVVEVRCADDARNWLREHHGIASSRLRNKELIAQAAETAGVKFVYPE